MTQIFRKSGRVGVPINPDGTISDGSGMVRLPSGGSVERAPLGMPHKVGLADAAAVLDVNDNRVAAGQSKTIFLKTSQAFAPKQLIVDSEIAAYFDILDLTNGNTSAFSESKGVAIPASTFSEVSTSNPLEVFEDGFTIDPSVPCYIEVRNRDTANIREFRAALLGSRLRQY